MAKVLATALDGKSQHERLEPIRPILAHDSDTAIATANLNNFLTVHELRRISQRKIGNCETVPLGSV
jgi:hypothetical protein